MTLEFAHNEAARRSRELGTTHVVLRSQVEIDEYLVTTRIPKGYIVVAIYRPWETI